MLISMVVILGLLIVACTLSKIDTGRTITKLEEELFQLIEEQRKTHKQLRLVVAALKSIEVRRELAQKECVRLQNDLFRIQAQVRSLAEAAQKRSDQEHSNRPF
ncbi:MAG: hypothetical protein IT369_19195 [Candidatus Latescibacteria bacterium]|nr:hypothetical protein [Candidatus Latescibacterota bacterium]